MHQRLDFRPQLDLSFVRSDRGTYLDRRIFRWPYAISRTFRLDRMPAGMLTLIVQSISGAIQADDKLAQCYQVGAGAMAHVTTPGAASVHRAPPRMEAVDHVDLVVEEGGFLEYLPEPRILFPDSCLSQRLRLCVAPGATAILSDAFTCHDPTGGDAGFRHFVSELLIERPGGQLLAVERIELDHLPRRSGRREHFSAYGTLIVSSYSDELLDRLTEAIDARTAAIEGLYLAVSALPNGAGVVLRVAAHDGRRLRQGLMAGWLSSRMHFFGEEPVSRGK
jgi:urease accessory protein